MTPHETVLKLVAWPLEAYSIPTPDLEQALALLRSLYGGGPEQPHFASMRKAEDEAAACLRVRQWAAARAETVSAPPTPPPPPPVDGGHKVKTRTPRPAVPPRGGAVDLL